MTAESDNFAKRLDLEFENILDEDLLDVKNLLTLDLLQRITAKMPVDTGRARGNTIVSVGSGDANYTEETDKDGDKTIAAGNAVLATDKDPFSPIFVQNNLPYIERLENGHSEQAPSGFWTLSFDEVRLRIR